MISLLNLDEAMFRPTSTFSSWFLTVCESVGLENRKYTSSAVLLCIFWTLVRQWFSPRCRAAGAVLCLWALALQTGNITQVALSMLTQVLSCRRRATQKPLRTLSKLHSGTSVSATAVSCYCSHSLTIQLIIFRLLTSPAQKRLHPRLSLCLVFTLCTNTFNSFKMFKNANPYNWWGLL